MALTIETYKFAISNVLDVALCIQDFPSEIVEKDNKPEVEMLGYNPKTKPLVLTPIYIARSDKEKCLIESSINSCRVKNNPTPTPPPRSKLQQNIKISFKIKQIDELDALIAERYSRYLAVRADNFEILRRVPLQGYDVTFLVLATHLEKIPKQSLIDWICSFVEEIEKELSEIKLNIISQTRIAATYYINSFSKKAN